MLLLSPKLQESLLITETDSFRNICRITVVSIFSPDISYYERKKKTWFHSITLYNDTDVISTEFLLSVKAIYRYRKCLISEKFVILQIILFMLNKLNFCNLEGESAACFPFILLIILQSSFPKNLIWDKNCQHMLLKPETVFQNYFCILSIIQSMHQIIREGGPLSKTQMIT